MAQSLIDRSLEENDPKPVVPSRISRLTALDQHVLDGRKHSLGAGGASALFSRAVEKALVDEIAEQLREGPFETQETDSEIRKWAAEIVSAFCEGE